MTDLECNLENFQAMPSKHLERLLWVRFTLSLIQGERILKTTFRNPFK